MTGGNKEGRRRAFTTKISFHWQCQNSATPPVERTLAARNYSLIRGFFFQALSGYVFAKKHPQTYFRGARKKGKSSNQIEDKSPLLVHKTWRRIERCVKQGLPVLCTTSASWRAALQSESAARQNTKKKSVKCKIHLVALGIIWFSPHNSQEKFLSPD